MSTVPALDVNTNPLTQEFEQIFREHSQLVYRTAFGVTGNAEDAEDVLQTIFMRLMRHGMPPNLQNNPKAYLYRAAVNVSLSTIRSRWRRVMTDDLEGLANSENAALSRDMGDIRERLLATLDVMTKTDSAAVEMLILRYVHNYSDADIAKTLGKTRGSVAVRLFRARARLKKLMRAVLGENHETTPARR
jgi:RNA polymerase sigma-70 factor (ECF subfamily)